MDSGFRLKQSEIMVVLRIKIKSIKHVLVSIFLKILVLLLAYLLLNASRK